MPYSLHNTVFMRIDFWFILTILLHLHLRWSVMRAGMIDTVKSKEFGSLSHEQKRHTSMLTINDSLPRLVLSYIVPTTTNPANSSITIPEFEFLLSVSEVVYLTLVYFLSTSVPNNGSRVSLVYPNRNISLSVVTNATRLAGCSELSEQKTFCPACISVPT